MLRRRKSQPLVERIAGWSTRHRLVAIGLWFALLLAAVAASAAVRGPGAPSEDPGETGRAERVMDAQSGYDAERESVLVARRSGGEARFADDPALTATTDELVRALRRSGGAAEIRTPPAADHVSADGRAGLVTFRLRGPDDALAAHYDATVRAVRAVAARHPGVRLAQSGDRSLSTAVDEKVKQDLSRSELTSLPVTLAILLVVFGSLVAAGIPILLTLTTVVTTMSLLSVVDHWIPVNSATSSMLLLISVAVGVDYSLFYLRREREERAAGHDVRTAVRIAAGTSGRVVVVSGLTVMLCLTGLLFTGIGQFRGLTIGTVIAVGLAVVGSVTVLPALLATLGHRVDRARIPWLGRRRTTAEHSRIWAGMARRVVRRPVRYGGIAVLALLFLAAPMTQLRLQDAGPTNSLPRSVPAVDAAIRMQQAFPGAASPARVVLWRADGRPVDSAALRQAVERLRGRIAVEHLAPVAVARVDRIVVVRVPLPGSGTDATSVRALELLRDKVLPATVGAVPGVRYGVAGRAAFAHDFVTQLRGRIPYVVGFVLALGFVLLLLAFRSVTIPLVSIVLNLLSVGAACGVLTWIFQDGHLGGLLGFTSYGGVVSWVPLFLFVLLFGLSMDYHIFILSRIRERFRAGVGARAAVVEGTARSAGVVTTAALIMTAVFSVFVTLSAIEEKMLGVGMAVAVLIDATVVRGVLLPAALSLLGGRAWPRRPATAAGAPVPDRAAAATG